MALRELSDLCLAIAGSVSRGGYPLYPESGISDLKVQHVKLLAHLARQQQAEATEGE